MILGDLIKGMNTVDKALLDYASQSNIAQFVKIGEGKYIGVYAERVPQLEPIQTTGNWSYGNIKE